MITAKKNRWVFELNNLESQLELEYVKLKVDHTST